MTGSMVSVVVFSCGTDHLTNIRFSSIIFNATFTGTKSIDDEENFTILGSRAHGDDAVGSVYLKD